MANRAVLQPNGFVARFSDVVDHFTHFNLEPEQLVRFYANAFLESGDVHLRGSSYTQEQARKLAEEKVQRGIDEGKKRFAEEISTIRRVHGALAAHTVKYYLSQPLDSNLPLPFSFLHRLTPDQELATYKAYLPSVKVGSLLFRKFAKQIAVLSGFIEERNAVTDKLFSQHMVEYTIDAFKRGETYITVPELLANLSILKDGKK